MASTFDERLELRQFSQKDIILDEHLLRYEFAKRFIAKKIVADIACGSGYGSQILARAGAEKVLAVDASSEAIDEAKKKYDQTNIVWQVGNAENLEIGAREVDVLISFETIEHLQHPEKFVQQAARILKSDGLVIISTPNKAVYHEANPYHIKEFTRLEFEEILGQHFQNVKILEQINGVASCLVARPQQDEHQFIFSNLVEPQFFIALCSNVALPEMGKNLTSFNPAALDGIYNNPGFKMVNNIYSLLSKIPGIAKIFDLIRKK